MIYPEIQISISYFMVLSLSGYLIYLRFLSPYLFCLISSVIYVILCKLSLNAAAMTFNLMLMNRQLVIVNPAKGFDKKFVF